jgi:hypothetical protein
MISAPAEDALRVEDGHYDVSRTTLIPHYYTTTTSLLLLRQ